MLKDLFIELADRDLLLIIHFLELERCEKTAHLCTLVELDLWEKSSEKIWVEDVDEIFDLLSWFEVVRQVGCDYWLRIRPPPIIESPGLAPALIIVIVSFPQLLLHILIITIRHILRVLQKQIKITVIEDICLNPVYHYFNENNISKRTEFLWEVFHVVVDLFENRPSLFGGFVCVLVVFCLGLEKFEEGLTVEFLDVGDLGYFFPQFLQLFIGKILKHPILIWVMLGFFLLQFVVINNEIHDFLMDSNVICSEELI